MARRTQNYKIIFDRVTKYKISIGTFHYYYSVTIMGFVYYYFSVETTLQTVLNICLKCAT